MFYIGNVAMPTHIALPYNPYIQLVKCAFAALRGELQRGIQPLTSIDPTTECLDSLRAIATLQLGVCRMNRRNTSNSRAPFRPKSKDRTPWRTRGDSPCLA